MSVFVVKVKHELLRIGSYHFYEYLEAQMLSGDLNPQNILITIDYQEEERKKKTHQTIYYIFNLCGNFCALSRSYFALHCASAT